MEFPILTLFHRITSTAASPTISRDVKAATNPSRLETLWKSQLPPGTQQAEPGISALYKGRADGFPDVP